MKNLRRRIESLLLAGLLLIGGAMQAKALDLNALAEEYHFADQSLEEIITQFRTTYGLDASNFAMSYTLVQTGEHYAFNEDRWMTAASVYKLPLNLYYADLVKNGELPSDFTILGYSLDEAQYQSIVYSNNEISEAMLYYIGNNNFRTYRELMTKWSDQDYSWEYYADNVTNARYMMDVLEYLYAHQADYPQIMAYLLEAEPGTYFETYVSEYEIAHKYGYFEGQVNDTAIVFTPYPYLVCALSEGVGAEPIARLNELLCAYTLSQTPFCLRKPFLLRLVPTLPPEADSADFRQITLRFA